MIFTRYAEPIFNPYSVVATSYVYDSNGGVSDESGWVNAKVDSLAVQVNVATLNATYLQYRIEGRSGSATYNRICEITTASINTAGGLDTVISVTEPVKYVRVGIKANNLATPNAIYGAILKSESR